MTEREVERWKGQPVCVVLKDGSYYVGWITEINRGELTLTGQKARGKMARSTMKQAEKAHLNGFFPFNPAAPFAGGWGADPFGFSPAFPQGGIPGIGGAAAGGGGFWGSLVKMWPGIKMGIGMLRTIMPLLGGLFKKA